MSLFVEEHNWCVGGGKGEQHGHLEETELGEEPRSLFFTPF